MECGISGYIPKTLESSIVLCALKLVFLVGVYLPPALLGKDRSRGDVDFIEANGGEVARLTSRQSDVLALVARGLSNKEIARDLELAEGTVKLHATALLKVLSVNNCTQAVVKENVLSLTSLNFTSRVSSEGTKAI